MFFNSTRMMIIECNVVFFAENLIKTNYCREEKTLCPLYLSKLTFSLLLLSFPNMCTSKNELCWLYLQIDINSTLTSILRSVHVFLPNLGTFCSFYPFTLLLHHPLNINVHISSTRMRMKIMTKTFKKLQYIFLSC